MNNTVAPPLLTVAQEVPEQWAGNQQPILPVLLFSMTPYDKE